MTSPASHTFFAPTPRGIAGLLAEEMRQLGALEVDEQRAGVGFSGSLEVAYRACLWSRFASRVLLVLGDLPAATADELYDSALAVRWDEHMGPSGTLAVNFNGTSPNLRHTHFGALRVKDAVVDGFRERNGTRPSVDVESPDLRIDVHLHGVLATISIDLSGRPLHRRGYRAQPVDAPLRENLAAAVLAKGGWPEVAAAGGPLLDLMCGSGTLLIEGAWMAADRAPALERDDLGFFRWAGHDAKLWDRLIKEARERYRQGQERLPEVVGYDIDPVAVRATRINLRRAGLSKRVRVETHGVQAGVHLGEPHGPGLVVANPPYGERLAEQSTVRGLYTQMATQLHERFGGWRAAILTTSDEWAIPFSLSSGPQDILYNGALECPLLHGMIPGHSSHEGGQGAGQATRQRVRPDSGPDSSPGSSSGLSPDADADPDAGPKPRARSGRGLGYRVAQDESEDRSNSPGHTSDPTSGPASDPESGQAPDPTSDQASDQASSQAPDPASDQASGQAAGGAAASQAKPASVFGARSEGAQMLANRLRKNLRTLGKWAKRQGISCYRLYDADMPEYALAIDVYESAESDRRWAHVQEYRAPASIDPARAAARLQEALPTIVEVLQLERQDLHFKLRERKKGKTQYQRLSSGGEFHAVREGPVTLFVNFTDYLDTGLFLDHRKTRMMIGEMAEGKRFLNLFGYTGSATVHAAVGGAAATTTVDMSNTYIEWARRNLHGNGHRGVPHNLVQADCLAWLEIPRAADYDLIFLDPPTFSNSKRMDHAFDIADEHVDLIEATARLLSDDGEILFSTNARQFKLDAESMRDLQCEDITWKTIPRDFERNAKIHQCWRITRR